MSYLPTMRHTILCVSVHTTPKTTAWVRATVVRLPPGGRDRRTPGVRTKKRTAAYRDIHILFV